MSWDSIADAVRVLSHSLLLGALSSELVGRLFWSSLELDKGEYPKPGGGVMNFSSECWFGGSIFNIRAGRNWKTPTAVCQRGNIQRTRKQDAHVQDHLGDDCCFVSEMSNPFKNEMVPNRFSNTAIGQRVNQLPHT